jgi:hypothetical protein
METHDIEIAVQTSLEFIKHKFNLNLNQRRMPIEIPNIGRNGMAILFNELGFKIGVEVGVETGKFSEVLCKSIPGVKLYSVDAWKAYRGYRDHVNQKKLDGFYETTKKRLAPYDCELIRKFSMDAVKDFKDNSLDFVYIDGNHNFQNCTNDIAEWSKKVRYGGIIAGHDYAKFVNSKELHVPQVVNGWTDAYQIRPWFLLGTKAKIDGIIRDEHRSFMWVHADWYFVAY